MTMTMTEQDRQQGFVRAVQEAERRFGMTIVAAIQPEMLGNVLQARATLTVAPIASWAPPQPEKPSEASEQPAGRAEVRH